MGGVARVWVRVCVCMCACGNPLISLLSVIPGASRAELRSSVGWRGVSLYGSLRVYTCVGVYDIYICAYAIYTRICVYIYMSIYMYGDVHVHIYIYACACACVCGNPFDPTAIGNARVHRGQC